MDADRQPLPSQSFQILDAQIEARAQAIRAERDWWTCRRGCDACCRQLAHPPELSAIAWERVDGAVAALPLPTQAIAMQKIDALLQQIAAQTPGAAVVCPYLDEPEGSCLIYAARPIACRTDGFFVARDHDQYCDQIATEVTNRNDRAIVWGNAESMRVAIAQIGGAIIPFERHYQNHGQSSSPHSTALSLTHLIVASETSARSV